MRGTLAVTLLLTVSAAAQEPDEAAPPEGPVAAEAGERREAAAPVEPPKSGRVRASAPAPPPSTALDRAPSVPDPWGGAQVVRTEDGEAVVRFGDAERTVRPGDRIGDAIVREVTERVIVLDRDAVAGRPGGVARVIVRFDAAGRPRVRTVYEEDPTRVEPTVLP